MKKSNVAFAEFSGREPQDKGRPIAEVRLNAPSDLPVIDLIELYASIEYALSSDSGRVVQFVSATSGFGSEQIALEMAWAATKALGKRILLVNCARFACNRLPERSHRDSVIQLATVENGMVKVAGQELYLADLRNGLSGAQPMTSLEEIDEEVEKLRRYFDMIVMLAPAADVDPLGVVMARHVDGSLIIVEAEQTRRAAAIRLREVLSRSGNPVIGAVLNNRQNYIPAWLARFL
jgi:protein-tyrosine kinase